MSRVIVAGCRNYVPDPENGRLVAEILMSLNCTTVISGGAKGADAYGEAIAQYMQLPIEVFPANWGKYGKKAGPIRNREMALEADHLIAIWDGFSKGTYSMIEIAKRCKLGIHIIGLDK